MAPEIPYELHELICGYLDTPTLKSYSLTCLQWHCIAQKFIFATITLRYPPRAGFNVDNRIETLLDLSIASPSISEAVRTVLFVDRGEVDMRTGDGPILGSLLSRLQNVKSFGMESIAYDSLQWTDVSRKIRQALIDIFHSDMLTNLALSGILGLPLSVLDGCPALEELSLELVSFQEKEINNFFSGSGKPTDRQERRTKLKSLHVTLSDPTFHFFSAWITSSVCNIDITNLQRLSVLETTNYDSVNRILHASATTLEIFCVHPKFEHFNPTNPEANTATDSNSYIAITKMSSLRILRIRLGRILSGSFPAYNMPSLRYTVWIISLASQLRFLASIAEISIYLEQAPLVEVWAVVDSILASYPIISLRRFTFIMPEEFYTRDEIKRSFPYLESQNILDVHVSEASSGFLCGQDNENVLARAKVY